MASSRKHPRKPGKKSGARIRQHIAVVPLGMKANDLELKARISLMKFASGIAIEAEARNWKTLELEQASLDASMGVLIEWFHAHGNNIKIAKAALSEIAKIERRA